MRVGVMGVEIDPRAAPTLILTIGANLSKKRRFAEPGWSVHKN
jgi:hypothetical protein